MQQPVRDRTHGPSLGDVLRDRAGVERGAIDVETRSGLEHDRDVVKPTNSARVDTTLEIDQRPAADAPDAPYIAHLGYAARHCAEDDRCDQHLDELYEDIAQRLERDAQTPARPHRPPPPE